MGQLPKGGGMRTAAGTQIKKPADAIPLVKKWANSRQENFIAITLDNRNYVIRIHHISKGIMNKTMIHPRECYYPAIKDNAASVIFLHNHTGGRIDPSTEDEDTTKRLCAAGSILGFHVLDHVIFTKDASKWYSFRQHGKIKDSDCQNDVDRYLASIE